MANEQNPTPAAHDEHPKPVAAPVRPTPPPLRILNLGFALPWKKR